MQHITFQCQSVILCANIHIYIHMHTHTETQLHITFILILFLHERGLALMQTFINLLYFIIFL